MSLGLLLLIIWVCIALLTFRFTPKLEEVVSDGWSFTIVIMVLLTFGLSGLAFHCYYFKGTERQTEVHEWHISSLGNDKGVSGEFFLGSGTIETTDYYFFFVRTTEGYLRLKEPVANTYIIETDERRPELVGLQTYYDDKDLAFKVWFDPIITDKKLYVPKGTIIKDFKVR